MNHKKEIMEAYFNTISKRTVEGDGVEVGTFVEDTNGNRFVVEAIATDYSEVKDYDTSKQAEISIKHNPALRQGQEWIACKDQYGQKSVQRYCDTGVTKVVEESFERKRDYVKSDRAVMEAFAAVVEGKPKADEAKEKKCCCGKDADPDKKGKCKKCGCGCEATEDKAEEK
jgi:hypothetical protein